MAQRDHLMLVEHLQSSLGEDQQSGCQPWPKSRRDVAHMITSHYLSYTNNKLSDYHREEVWLTSWWTGREINDRTLFG